MKRIDWNKRIIPSQIQLAYIAGIFDGEGNINISRHKNRWLSQYLRCSIVNTDLAVIKYVDRFFPAFVLPIIPKNSKNKVVYRFQISGVAAYDFLKDILPFLIIKKQRAELAIFFQENRKSVNCALPDAVLKEEEFRDSVYSEMAKLNRRGSLITAETKQPLNQCGARPPGIWLMEEK